MAEGGSASFGMRLRAYRVAAGVSQAELAERSEVSLRAISDLERGRTRWPHQDSLHRLARALKLTDAATAELIALAQRRLGHAAAEVIAPSAASGPVDEDAGQVVPRELPGVVPHFVGRADELKVLTDLLAQADLAELPGTVVISAIGGTGGVGKTALALHWAHLVQARFPDGQLYVNLRGYDSDQPVAAVAALAGFLRSLGVAGADIPPEEAERAARYRSLVAGKKILVVLDNARDEAQVRPLLPGASSCMTLVTSRDSLSGLAVRDGAVRLDLDMLPWGDAIALLERLIGDRARADSASTRALAQACGRLPLALRIAAELAVVRRAEPLAALAAELAGQQRLDMLAAGRDSSTAVRTVFSWSYRHLDPATARAFRLIGMHPGPAFDRYAVAALTGTTVPQAAYALDSLANKHLTQPAGPGRYGLHDLVRAYARELTAASEQRPVLIRLLDFYLRTAAIAMDTIYPSESFLRPVTPESDLAHPVFGSETAARQWLDAERPSLVAMTEYAAGHDLAAACSRMSATLARYLDAGGYSAEAQTIHELARAGAAQGGDRAGEAAALVRLAAFDSRRGDLRQAAARYHQAILLFADIGDRAGQARVQHNLGHVDGQLGRQQEAYAHFRYAQEHYRETGDKVGEGRVLADLGMIEVGKGSYRQALHYYQQSLALCCETGDRFAEATVLVRLARVDFRQGRPQRACDNLKQVLAASAENGDRFCEATALNLLGQVHLGQGRYRQATECLQQGTALCREIGYRGGEADALDYLGLVEAGQCRHQEAIDYLQQSLALAREVGEPEREAEALNGLGGVYLAIARPSAARDCYADALSMAISGCEKYEEARAHHGLGDACHALGDHKQANGHWRRAHVIYAELEVPEATQIAARLAETGSHLIP
jgi:tetratricopeptide (TPR) repeat protein/transcriptional regulator with XRE-family HTH domain